MPPTMQTPLPSCQVLPGGVCETAISLLTGSGSPENRKRVSSQSNRMGFYSALLFALNNFSILSVIAKPPITLKLAQTMAIAPKHFSSGVVGTENNKSAPKMVTAETALVIDINGVCKRDGTLKIRTYPIRKDAKNTPTIRIKFDMGLPLISCDLTDHVLNSLMNARTALGAHGSTQFSRLSLMAFSVPS